jgi:cytoskeleton protein RodZ
MQRSDAGPSMNDAQLNEQLPVGMETGKLPEAAQAILGPGAQLAIQRQAKGYTVEQVANQLNLAPRQIQALEVDNYAALPGVVIARGFIRAYAKLLKIDPEPLVTLMQGDVAPMESIQLKRALSGSFSESRLPPTVSSGLLSKWVIGAALLVLIAIGLFTAHWYGLIPVIPETTAESNEKGTVPLSTSTSTTSADNSASGISSSSDMSPASKVTKDEIAAPIASSTAPAMTTAPTTSAATAQATAPISAPVTPLALASAPATASIAPSKFGSTTVPITVPTNLPKTIAPTVPITAPASTPAIAPKATSVPSAAQPQAATRQPDSHSMAPSVQDSSNAAGKNMLVMKLREDSWVEVRAIDNSILISRLMKAGSTEILPITKPISITVGNVAGIDMTLRGNPVDLKSAEKNNIARLNLK